MFLVLLLTTMLFVGWFHLSKFSDAYEKTLPDTIMEDTITLFEKGDYHTLFEKSDTNLLKFEEVNDIKKNLDISIGKPLTFFHDKKMDYIITDSETHIATITLKTAPTYSEYGLSPLALEKIHFHTQPLPQTTIIVPSGSQVEVNGIVATPQDIARESRIVNDFGLDSDHPFVLKEETITLPSLLVAPQINVSHEGIALDIAPQLGKNTYIKDMDDNAKQKAVATATAKAYANYITNDLSFSDISHLFMKGTSTYDNLRSFYNGWYITHDSFAFEDMDCEFIQSNINGVVECRVTFNYIVTKGYIQEEYLSDYTIHLAPIDNTLKAISLTIN